MCDAGRIRHHLKYNLWRGDSAVVFVGLPVPPARWAAPCWTARPASSFFGEDIAVRAKIVNFQGLSSHADHDHLVDWVKHFNPAQTIHVFVVHGDREVAPVFADTVKSLGFAAHAPQYTGGVRPAGRPSALPPATCPSARPVPTTARPKATPAYQKLVQLGDMLIGLIRRSKGRDNKTLAAFCRCPQQGHQQVRVLSRAGEEQDLPPPASRATPPRGWAWPASAGRRCSSTGPCRARRAMCWC